MTATLSALQLKQLSADLNPNRIAHRKGQGGSSQLSYLEAWDVRASLIRVFGYGGFSYDTSVEIVRIEDGVKKSNGSGTQFRITALATVRLCIPALGAYYQESAVSSQSQPDPGECADFAVKTAESDALKRCAVNLGTQFGLSLYNRGATADVVKVVREPAQAAILARLATGETAASIDASTAKSEIPAGRDAPDPADSDFQHGYDPEHGDTGMEPTEPTAPGEDPRDDMLPEPPDPAKTASARASVRAGFNRTQN